MRTTYQRPLWLRVMNRPLNLWGRWTVQRWYHGTDGKIHWYRDRPTPKSIR